MVSDIFIKTCYKDYVWLDGCLSSIKKYASGFRDVVVVTEPDHEIPRNFFDIIPLKVHYVQLPAKLDYPVAAGVGLGYLWQQNIKLNWFNYTDADFVIIVDSDEMFLAPFSPESFYQDDKINWWVRTWADAPTCGFHKDNTDLILGVNTEYETMACPVFSFDRETTIQFIDFLCKKHDVNTLWDIVLKYRIDHMSEFNIFGNYLVINNIEKYKIRFDIGNSLNFQIVRVFWSWGGLNLDLVNERKRILDS